MSAGVLAMDGPSGVGEDRLSTTAVSGASGVRLTSAAVSERFPLGPEWGRGEVLSSLTVFEPVEDEGMDLCHGVGIDDRGHPAMASLTQVTQKETVGGWAAAYFGPDEARDALHQAQRAAAQCPLKDGRSPVLKASQQSVWTEFSFLTTYTRLSDSAPTVDVNTAVTVRQSGNVATVAVYQHQGVSDAVLRSGVRKGSRSAVVSPRRPQSGTRRSSALQRERTACSRPATPTPNEQQLQRIAAQGLAEMYFRAGNARAAGLGVEFTGVEHIQIEL
ncbi:hypothetical protein [Streptomyces sp. NPDC059805]|uniref:hypothetical protein n=1 Tax=Streptomyces sp. NPDC059805 TaxID=3346954 RepID=UPI003650D087